MGNALTKGKLERIHGTPEGIDIEALVITMGNAAAILADYIRAHAAIDPYTIPKGFTHGADDSTFDYIPNGLDIVKYVIEVWGAHVEPGENRWPNVGKGEFAVFQDCTSDDAVESIQPILAKSGFAIQE